MGQVDPHQARIARLGGRGSGCLLGDQSRVVSSEGKASLAHPPSVEAGTQQPATASLCTCSAAVLGTGNCLPRHPGVHRPRARGQQRVLSSEWGSSHVDTRPLAALTSPLTRARPKKRRHFLPWAQALGVSKAGRTAGLGLRCGP